MFIEKPWGSEELLEKNEIYVVKRLVMKKGCRCSLQYHVKKTETIYIVSGQLRIFLGDADDKLESRVYKENEFITIPSGMIHRMEGVTDCCYLEASTPELEDVVRVEDDYNRI